MHGNIAWAALSAVVASVGVAAVCQAAPRASDVDNVVNRACDWLASRQSHSGHWTGPDGRYPTAMTGMAGIALLCEGSTTTQGKYSKNISKAVEYLVSRSCKNGLIGDPLHDDRYTYGHGFSMLFLSQVLGEEEDADRRKELIEVLKRAVVFSGRAQTKAGGWGYVSAKDGGDFDEGSTTITQVQGLRGCRNAGVPVPREIIDRAIKYIHDCTGPDGGVAYNSRGGGGRPPITAAALACLFNAGEYDKQYVPRLMKYCQQQFADINNSGSGHWHYAHYYYAQVLYREGGEPWEKYRKLVSARLVGEARQDGQGSYWDQGFMGPIYTTSMNLVILQLDRAALPIYQR